MKYLLLLPLCCFAEVTFIKDVRPVFFNRCSKCHNVNTSLGNWLAYEEAYGKRFTIRNRVQSRKMPHFTQESMTEYEIGIIIDWVNTGAKQ